MRGKIVDSFRDFENFDHFPYKMIIFPRILENIFFRRLKNVLFSKIQIRFENVWFFWKAEDLYFRLVMFLGCVCWTQKSPERNMWKIVDFQKINHFLGGWEKILRKKIKKYFGHSSIHKLSKKSKIKRFYRGSSEKPSTQKPRENHTPPVQPTRKIGYHLRETTHVSFYLLACFLYFGCAGERTSKAFQNT